MTATAAVVIIWFKGLHAQILSLLPSRGWSQAVLTRQQGKGWGSRTEITQPMSGAPGLRGCLGAWTLPPILMPFIIGCGVFVCLSPSPKVSTVNKGERGEFSSHLSLLGIRAGIATLSLDCGFRLSLFFL